MAGSLGRSALCLSAGGRRAERRQTDPGDAGGDHLRDHRRREFGLSVDHRPVSRARQATEDGEASDPFGQRGELPTLPDERCPLDGSTARAGGGASFRRGEQRALDRAGRFPAVQALCPQDAGVKRGTGLGWEAGPGVEHPDGGRNDPGAASDALSEGLAARRKASGASRRRCSRRSRPPIRRRPASPPGWR